MTDQMEYLPASGLARIAAAALAAPISIVAVRRDGRLRVAAQHGANASPASLEDAIGRCDLCARAMREEKPVTATNGQTDSGPVTRLLGAGSCVLASFPRVTGVEGLVLVLDTRPRAWEPGEVGLAAEVAAAVAGTMAPAGRDDSRSLAAAEAHYRRLFESSPVAIFAIDMEGRFTEVNPAAEAMAGRGTSEMVGRHFSEVVAPEDVGMARDRTDRMYAGEVQTDEFELQVIRPSGERRLMRARFSPIREGDELRGVHGVARDVTEERARAGYMRRAERLATVGTLLSGVAHELNNPLNAIRNFAQLMLLDDRGEDDREALEIIQNEADRAAKIVADLRLIARQTRETEGDRDLVDLNEIVSHLLKLRRYTLETHNIAVSKRLAPNLPAVLANREEIEQVVLNLLLNAEEALAGRSGEREITISTRPAPNGVHLQVADTGPGIAAGNLERVFEPFWTTKAPGEGTGLGLSLVHRIVTDHGGEVRARTEPGSGAVFTLVLPRVGELADAGARAPLEEPTRPLRILLVDDEAPIRTSIARYLRRRGHQADEARDGGEALTMLGGAADYDVILTDLRMPGMGGEQLLERLREAGGDLHRRVIVITGDVAHADAARIVEATGAPTLIKPVGLHEVARAIEEYAENIYSLENAN